MILLCKNIVNKKRNESKFFKVNINNKQPVKNQFKYFLYKKDYKIKQITLIKHHNNTKKN